MKHIIILSLLLSTVGLFGQAPRTFPNQDVLLNRNNNFNGSLVATNVGIGTNSPQAKLHVSGPATSTLSMFQTTRAANPGVVQAIGLEGEEIQWRWRLVGEEGGSAEDGSYRLYRGNSTSAADLIINIRTNGGVWIQNGLLDAAKGVYIDSGYILQSDGVGSVSGVSGTNEVDVLNRLLQGGSWTVLGTNANVVMGGEGLQIKDAIGGTRASLTYSTNDDQSIMIADRVATDGIKDNNGDFNDDMDPVTHTWLDSGLNQPYWNVQGAVIFTNSPATNYVDDVMVYVPADGADLPTFVVPDTTYGSAVWHSNGFHFVTCWASGTGTNTTLVASPTP